MTGALGTGETVRPIYACPLCGGGPELYCMMCLYQTMVCCISSLDALIPPLM